MCVYIQYICTHILEHDLADLEIYKNILNGVDRDIKMYIVRVKKYILIVIK